MGWWKYTNFQVFGFSVSTLSSHSACSPKISVPPSNVWLESATKIASPYVKK